MTNLTDRLAAADRLATRWAEGGSRDDQLVWELDQLGLTLARPLERLATEIQVMDMTTGTLCGLKGGSVRQRLDAIKREIAKISEKRSQIMKGLYQ